ncbi:sigma-70 family RNA polymerase sigma factor [Mycolicibacterium fortuitum]|uniref:sigma-70 family RNA polymerase sigma factor n=1 Tax=Mycolicibacterium fortuitum TaxID=1766 RepID=UPI00148FBEE2|nr:sigma-70 family RNA polymerase sigma factor [Mycolicibacterium fortuitum]
MTRQLQQQAVEGDRAASFASQIEPCLPALRRQSRRLTNTHTDAEDLLQEVLLHAYKGFHTFSEGTNLNAWLFRILHNRWANAHRTKARRPVEVSTELASASGAFRVEATDSAETEALRTLTDDALRAAVSSLPQGAKEVLYYANVCGYTYAETAVVLNLPRGTVMSRAWRARERLRELLGVEHEAKTGSHNAVRIHE